MATSDQDLRILLLQIRERTDVEQQEQRCFIERCGIQPHQLDALNLLHDPFVSPERIEAAHAVMIGGSGIHSATQDYPFTNPLIDTLQHICQEGKPYFGACWGHQFLVRAMGGQVVTDPSMGEVGTHDVQLNQAGQADPLFQGFPERFAAHMGHHDYAHRLPDGCTSLALSDVCPNQAFRLQDKPIYGTQFHVELNAQRLAERLAIYQDIYVPDDDEFDHIKDTPRPTPQADTILRRFLELYVLN